MSMYVPRKLVGGWPSSAVRSQVSAVFHSTLLVKRPSSDFGQTYVTAHSTPVVSRAEMLKLFDEIRETERVTQRRIRRTRRVEQLRERWEAKARAPRAAHHQVVRQVPLQAEFRVLHREAATNGRAGRAALVAFHRLIIVASLDLDRH